MPALDIDRDAAADAAREELAKLIYPKPSLPEQVSQWVEQLLYRLTARGAEVPGGWLTVAVLALLVAAAMAVAIRTARRALRTGVDAPMPLSGGDDLSAAEHRATADAAAAQQDWPAAIGHRLRAIARHLEDTGVLAPSPGRTATELARSAGPAFPDVADRLTSAAVTFDAVTYGDDPGDDARYQAVTALDRLLAGRRPTPHEAAASDTPWAGVR